MKWEVVQHLFILIFALVQSRVHSECSDIPEKVLDITQPLNAAVAKTISEEQFISNLKLKNEREINLSTSIKDVLGMYETGCSAAKVCEDRIRQVLQFAENVIKKRINILLMISLTFNINNQKNSASLLAGTEFIFSHKIMILFRLPDNITCSDLKTYVESNGRDALFKGSSARRKNGTTLYGLGYNSNLINCSPLKEVLYGTSFSVLFLKFGNRMWIPESFGIFKNIMNSLHERNIQLVGKIPTQFGLSSYTRIKFYIPVIKYVQTENYTLLLERFANKWMAQKTCDARIILPSNLPSIEVIASDNFSLSTYVRQRNMWFIPRALHIMTKHFKSIFLLYDDWIFFHSKRDRAKQLYANYPKKLLFDRKLDVILDFPYSSTKGLPNDTDLETHFRNSILSNPLEHINVRALLITIVNSNGSYSANTNETVVRKVSKDYIVGCRFAIESLEYDENSYTSLANSIVTSCKRSNGSMYVLYTKIELEENKLNTNRYYIDVVRKGLEALKLLRHHILKEHINIDGSVYIHADLSASDSSLPNNTLFCNGNTLTLNEYYEAILTWGKLNNLPIILKTAFDAITYPDTTSWFSYLRPVFGLPPLTKILPFFVLRNYPVNINNWTTDPCIQWTTSRPIIQSDFFHNRHVGAVYHTSMRDFNETSHDFSYKIMLQFVFNRFQEVEVVVENNWGNVFKAFSELIPERTFDRKHIYFNYDFKHGVNNTKELFVSFNQLLKELQSYKLPNVLGVHLNLAQIYLNILKVDDDEELILETTALWENVASTSLELNIRLGILISLESCFVLYQKFATGRPSKYFKLVSLADYIVCNDEFNLETVGTMENLGGKFDTHLYIKNGFQDGWPRLTTIIRTAVVASLEKNPATMNHYVTALSHFQKFSKAYDTKYFLVEAFDRASDTTNGWWSIKNYEDLDNPDTYSEKEAEYSQFQMWVPKLVNAKSFHNYFTTFEVIAIATAVVSIVIVISGIIVGYVFRRYRTLKRYLSEEEVKAFLNGRQKPVNGDAVEEIADITDPAGLKFNSDYQLSRSEFIIDDSRIKLGAGAFGTVYKGLVNGRPAAIKTPNQNCSKCTFKNILCEVKVLCHIGEHQNVVRFLGAYVKEIEKGILYIATELCSNGSLEIFLRKHKNVILNDENIDYQNTQIETTLHLSDLVRISLEIARAMEYIHERCVLHGDLAARNVLLSENLTCKVGDFGLSRKVYEYQKYVKKSQDPLPWKWMAFESLTKMEFTRQSDVWSYGITLWEIYSLGAIPYGGLNWTVGFAEELSNGRRLNCPKYAPETIYRKMLECWHMDINHRPAFGDIVDFFQCVTNNENGVLWDYTNMPSSNFAC